MDVSAASDATEGLEDGRLSRAELADAYSALAASSRLNSEPFSVVRHERGRVGFAEVRGHRLDADHLLGVPTGLRASAFFYVLGDRLAFDLVMEAASPDEEARQFAATLEATLEFARSGSTSELIARDAEVIVVETELRGVDSTLLARYRALEIVDDRGGALVLDPVMTDALSRAMTAALKANGLFTLCLDPACHARMPGVGEYRVEGRSIVQSAIPAAAASDALRGADPNCAVCPRMAYSRNYGATIEDGSGHMSTERSQRLDDGRWTRPQIARDRAGNRFGRHVAAYSQTFRCQQDANCIDSMEATTAMTACWDDHAGGVGNFRDDFTHEAVQLGVVLPSQNPKTAYCADRLQMDTYYACDIVQRPRAHIVVLGWAVTVAAGYAIGEASLLVGAAAAAAPPLVRGLWGSAAGDVGVRGLALPDPAGSTVARMIVRVSAQCDFVHGPLGTNPIGGTTGRGSPGTGGVTSGGSLEPCNAGTSAGTTPGPMCNGDCAKPDEVCLPNLVGPSSHWDPELPCACVSQPLPRTAPRIQGARTR